MREGRACAMLFSIELVVDEKQEYSPGDVVPVSSSLYCVVHEPSDGGEYLKTFHAGEIFPPCEECGTNVRYLLPVSIIERAC